MQEGDTVGPTIPKRRMTTGARALEKVRRAMTKAQHAGRRHKLYLFIVGFIVLMLTSIAAPALAHGFGTNYVADSSYHSWATIESTWWERLLIGGTFDDRMRSEEHTSELQSH